MELNFNNSYYNYSHKNLTPKNNEKILNIFAFQHSIVCTAWTSIYSPRISDTFLMNMQKESIGEWKIEFVYAEIKESWASKRYERTLKEGRSVTCTEGGGGGSKSTSDAWLMMRLPSKKESQTFPGNARFSPCWDRVFLGFLLADCQFTFFTTRGKSFWNECRWIQVYLLCSENVYSSDFLKSNICYVQRLSSMFWPSKFQSDLNRCKTKTLMKYQYFCLIHYHL